MIRERANPTPTGKYFLASLWHLPRDRKAFERHPSPPSRQQMALPLTRKYSGHQGKHFPATARVTAVTTLRRKVKTETVFHKSSSERKRSARRHCAVCYSGALAQFRLDCLSDAWEAPPEAASWAVGGGRPPFAKPLRRCWCRLAQQLPVPGSDREEVVGDVHSTVCERVCLSIVHRSEKLEIIVLCTGPAK